MITSLRQKMIDAMLVRGFSPRTHSSYLYAVTDLARHYRRSSEHITLEEIQDYSPVAKRRSRTLL